MCPYVTEVQYILHLWLCTHQCSALFLVRHFIACHDEVMLTLSFKCQKICGAERTKMSRLIEPQKKFTAE